MDDTFDESETTSIGDESTLIVDKSVDEHFLYDIQTCANWANYIYFNQVVFKKKFLPIFILIYGYIIGLNFTGTKLVHEHDHRVDQQWF